MNSDDFGLENNIACSWPVCAVSAGHFLANSRTYCERRAQSVCVKKAYSIATALGINRDCVIKDMCSGYKLIRGACCTLTNPLIKLLSVKKFPVNLPCKQVKFIYYLLVHTNI